jgi:uncharacterized protein involved in cysteine biosynthesis
MILSAFLSALGQLPDRRFLKVMGLGIALSLALLIAVYAGFVQLIDWATPEALTLPWVGEVTWVTDLLGWGSLLLMIGLSVFLMVPVAALFSGLCLEDVADAVEDRHYPALPPARPQGLYQSLIGSVNFFGVLVAVNALALIGYVFVGPFAPLLFWAVNGYLLGREYFQTVAARRLDRASAKALRKANAGTIWLAGCLMAAPLSLPFVNLAIPVLGVATFTHIFHRLSAR